MSVAMKAVTTDRPAVQTVPDASRLVWRLALVVCKCMHNVARGPDLIGVKRS